MTDVPPGAGVVVGVDGSAAALDATVWAVDEAIARDLPVRLVCAVGLGSDVGLSPNEFELGVQFAESALRQARATIEETGKDVEVDTAILRGAPADVLLAESRTAELVCLGSAGLGTPARRSTGSTATTVAEGAACPVAVIRHPEPTSTQADHWIAVAVKASTDDEQVVLTAMREAHVRHLPIMAIGLWHDDFGLDPDDELDRLMQSWRQRFPDVHVDPVTTRSDLVEFLARENEPVAMVIVGSDEAARVAELVGPHGHPNLGHPECSVLVVRP